MLVPSIVADFPWKEHRVGRALNALDEQLPYLLKSRSEKP
jgi:hypothetical protein